MPGRTDTIQVNKEKLIAIIKQNREEHAVLYKQACDAYRDRMIEELNSRIELLKDGKSVDHYIKLPIPEEHLDEYDSAIDRYEWHLADEIWLTEIQFNELVRNNWGWGKSFTSNTMSYNSR